MGANNNKAILRIKVTNNSFVTTRKKLLDKYHLFLCFSTGKGKKIAFFCANTILSEFFHIRRGDKFSTKRDNIKLTENAEVFYET